MTDLFGQKLLFIGDGNNHGKHTDAANSTCIGMLDYPQIKLMPGGAVLTYHLASSPDEDDKTHAWMNEVVLGGKDG